MFLSLQVLHHINSPRVGCVTQGNAKSKSSWRGIVLPRQTEIICLLLCKVQSYKLEGQERQRPRKTNAQKDEGQESKGILPAAWNPLSKLKLNGR